ncbi:restriction endonuclease subunit S [Bacteroides gallinaceum]|uniref:restriction endonuclease subunit S n=1 Tax=Bacteroides gallinaceum TaxID=1462571 RepID=UPI001EF73A6E|nr:restriction endonuclease subunit S [Bacteroides gallinaceum]
MRVQSQFIEMFGNHSTTPVSHYIDDSYPGEWGVEDRDGSGVKVIRTTNFTNAGKLDLTNVVTRSILEKKVKRKAIKKFDTILERSGGTAENPVGRVVLFEEDDQYLCNNFTQVLRFKDIEPRYAFYALFYYYQMNKTVVRSMGSKTTGIQNLNMNKYLEIGVPDASDEEQRLFIAIAEQADKSKFVGFKSQFIEMTTRSELNKKSIGEIAEVRTGSTPSRSNPEYWNGTHYWVSAQDMGNKYIYDTLEKITDKGYATCKVVPAGSILYVCRGSIGVMSINTMDCATNQSICTATCKTGYNTEYLYYALKVAEKAIKKQGIGTSFKSLNQSAFASIEILFPAIEIQDKFATIAKQADKSKYYN